MSAMVRTDNTSLTLLVSSFTFLEMSVPLAFDSIPPALIGIKELTTLPSVLPVVKPKIPRNMNVNIKSKTHTESIRSDMILALLRPSCDMVSIPIVSLICAMIRTKSLIPSSLGSPLVSNLVKSYICRSSEKRRLYILNASWNSSKFKVPVLVTSSISNTDSTSAP